ncbi:MAG: SMC-Scp complex subunit ScpB [archaeon]
MKHEVEAALYMAGRRVTPEEICKILGIDSVEEVKKALDELTEEYKNRDTAIQIGEENGRYRMEVRHKYLDKVQHMAPQMDMSRAVLTILSYIAYKQPVRQANLVNKFGNRVYDYIKELEKRGLINSEPRGHSKELTTTTKLLTFLGEPEATRIKEALDAAKAKKELEQMQAEDKLKEKVKKQREIMKILKTKDRGIDEWMGVAKGDKEQELLDKLEKFEKELEKDYDDSEEGEEFEP